MQISAKDAPERIIILDTQLYEILKYLLNAVLGGGSEENGSLVNQ